MKTYASIRITFLFALVLLAGGAPDAQAETKDIFPPDECNREVRDLLYQGANAAALKDAYRRMYACRTKTTCPRTEAELDFLASCNDYQALEKLSLDLAAQRGAPALGPELAAKALGGCSPTQLEEARSKGLLLARFVDPDGDEGPKAGRCIDPTKLSKVPAPGAEDDAKALAEAEKKKKEEEEKAKTPSIRSSKHLVLHASVEDGSIATRADANPTDSIPAPKTTHNYTLLTLDGEVSSRFRLLKIKDSLDEEWGPLEASQGERFFIGVIADPALGGSASVATGIGPPGSDPTFKRFKLKAGHASIMIRHKKSNGSNDATYEFLPVSLVMEKDSLTGTSIKGLKLGILDIDARGSLRGSGPVDGIIGIEGGTYVGEHEILTHETDKLAYINAKLGLGVDLGVVGDLTGILEFDFKASSLKDDSSQTMTLTKSLNLNDIARTKLGIGAAVQWTSGSASSDYDTTGRVFQAEGDSFGVILEFAPKFDLGGAETGL